MGEKRGEAWTDGVNAFMREWQNGTHVAQRQAERQFRTALAACYALAAMPSRFLGT